VQGCLDDNALAAYVDGALSPDEIARVDTHISDCASCRRDLSAMAAAHSVVTVPGGDHGDAAGELVPGETIGRYVVEREHARGGMGVVAIAYDPELGRNVALKVLRPDVAGPSPEHLRDEARAMAKLSHPNVVSVYDVGEHGGRIFIAMELVQGASLRQWLAEEPRSWRAIVGTLLRAGRGLAAAHRAQLVHRDFKPDNVLCGPDDRVRVTDFGLARGGGGDGGAPRIGIGTGIVGTPSYMAPEVWRREPATARSDQWSFCVTLYEALFGALPFTGTTADELRAAIDKAEPAVPRTRVPAPPAAIVRALMRGLARDPAARFASLDDLLAELAAVLRRPRPAVLVGGGVAIAALAGAALVFGLSRGGDASDPCQMPPSLIEGAWSSARGTALATGFAATGRKHAPDTARRVRERLDRYATDWLAARADACIATRVRGDQSPALLDARTRCLDRRRDELAELARRLTDKPVATVVDGAVEAVSGLLRIDTCSATGVATEVPLPNDPVRAAQIAALDKEIAQARAAVLAKQVKRADGATAEAERIVARAKALAYPPLTARALRLLGSLASYASDQALAERALYDAIAAAAAAHDDRAAADMWIALMAFTAMDKGDAAAALDLAKPAEAAMLRADSPPELRRAFHHGRGITYVMQGKYAEARDAFRLALATAPPKLETATTQTALCGVEVRLGELQEAKATCQRALTTFEAEVGPQHPLVGFGLLNLGNVELELHEDAAAAASLERSLAIIAETVGEQHVSYVLALNNLGMITRRKGDTDAARRYFERSIAGLAAKQHPEQFQPLANLASLERDLGHGAESRKRWEQALAVAQATHGPDSERVARALYSLGTLDHDAGNLDAAVAKYQRALAIHTKLSGGHGPYTSEVLDGLGFVYEARHDCKRAIIYQKRAVALDEETYGTDHPSVAEKLTSLGNCERQVGDVAAIANLDRALAIHDRFPSGRTFEPAFTRWALAQALRRFHRDPERAIALARDARALYAKSTEPEAAAVLPEIDRWLAAGTVASDFR